MKNAFEEEMKGLNEYIMTSIRFMEKPDEERNTWYTSEVYSVDDVMVDSDGLIWVVDEVVRIVNK